MSVSSRLSDIVEPESQASTPEARAARLRLSLEMADAGVRMMRQNLRRRHPDRSEHQIETELAAWLQGNPSVDCDGAWSRLAPERFSDL